jgi:hypothetical protein
VFLSFGMRERATLLGGSRDADWPTEIFASTLGSSLEVIERDTRVLIAADDGLMRAGWSSSWPPGGGRPLPGPRRGAPR